MLAGGHLLIEDLPGTGKTTLSQALARVLGLEFQRIQFTSDLLPADIVGVSIYHQNRSQFDFHPGPIFKQVVLADEVNRATPKTQSALLEAMEERQVTVDGETHHLPAPFFVIATQNPSSQIGTFPLPESQLDRFLMQVAMAPLSDEAERALLQGQDRREMIGEVQPAMSAEALLTLQQQVRAVKVNDRAVAYAQALLKQSRDKSLFSEGLSPRAGLGLIRIAQASALLDGRDFVQPEDFQRGILPLARHRLQNLRHELLSVEELRELLIEAVPVE
ncbi:ATPase, AAA family [gamma proteobacterium HTCC5015]|nr:ATPase, AAA family [gamma proteobacterium HTCC5015]